MNGDNSIVAICTAAMDGPIPVSAVLPRRPGHMPPCPPRSPVQWLDAPATTRQRPPAPRRQTDDRDHPGDGALLCALCRHPVTHPRERIVRAGAHEHGRMNPAGFSFHLACFAAAPGAMVVGPATLEHTWFAGHGWRIALCGGCGEQLGWRFEAPDGDRFYGLIVGRLVAADTPET
ncbi:MAG: cereblon family protein [Gammaproteobacteria bacterium]|nr:cereblon family protein [Gammaproteobacteria bacterium]